MQKIALTVPRPNRNTRYNICLTTLIGIPGAGKTTFVERLKELDRTHQLVFSIVHICYDDFIVIDRNVQNWNFKNERKAVLQFVKQLIRWYQTNRLNAPLHYTGRVKISTEKSSKATIVFVIDDNMYYRSMRFEYLKICKRCKIGYFPIFFDCDLTVALQRNSGRSNSLPEEVIHKMHSNLQKPNPEKPWEADHLVLPTNFEVDDYINQLNELIAKKVLAPEKVKKKKPLVPGNVRDAIEQILRKEIHRRIETILQSEGDKRLIKTTVDELNARKKFVRQKLDNGSFPMPTDLNDVIDLLDTTTFQDQ